MITSVVNGQTDLNIGVSLNCMDGQICYDCSLCRILNKLTAQLDVSFISYSFTIENKDFIWQVFGHPNTCPHFWLSQKTQATIFPENS